MVWRDNILKHFNFPIVVLEFNTLNVSFSNNHIICNDLATFFRENIIHINQIGNNTQHNGTFMFPLPPTTIKAMYIFENDFLIVWLLPEDYNVDKNTFVASFSHEIRTPLNGIIGITNLLEETKCSSEQKDLIDMIKECNMTLLAIVNDILDYANIEKGQLVIRDNPFKLSELVEKAYYIMLPKARSKALEFTFEITKNIPEYYIGDIQRLQQVLVNLLSNAIKFTHYGSVKTVINYINNQLIFKVIDTGIGISEKFKIKIFSIHGQNVETTQDYTGTGLGLLISRRLVELMNGEIYLESSEKDKGSTFVFELPLNSVLVQQEQKDLLIQKIKGKNVLIVDDAAANRISISGMVIKFGMIPVPVSTLNEAVLLSESMDFSIGLIDLHLNSSSDGIQVAKRLLEKEKKFPLIALSSLGNKIADLQEYFYFHLTKPVREQKLFECILKCLNAHIEVEPELPQDDSKNNICILLAEDVYINQKVFVGLLKSLNYTNVTVFPDGFETLFHLETHDDYNIIFLDIKMPLGGIETFKQIQNIYNKKNKPVPYCVATTAYILKDGYVDQYHFDDYIYKPIQKKALKEVFERYLNK